MFKFQSVFILFIFLALACGDAGDDPNNNANNDPPPTDDGTYSCLFSNSDGERTSCKGQTNAGLKDACLSGDGGEWLEDKCPDDYLAACLTSNPLGNDYYYEGASDELELYKQTCEIKGAAWEE